MPKPSRAAKKKALGIMLAHPFATRKEGIMQYKQILTGSVGKKEAICIALLGLVSVDVPPWFPMQTMR
jgi:hypothetical protein